MTYALNTTGRLAASFASGEHPHQPAGSSTGGQFAPTGNSNKSGNGSKSGKSGNGGKSAPAKKAPARRPVQRRTIPKGKLGFDGVSGTGYNLRNGDSRVRALQQSLNRLGLKDANGQALKVDGRLGPRTTAAIKAMQAKLGMKADGIVDEAFIAKLRSTKSPAKAPAKRAPAKAPAKQAVKAADGEVKYADPGYQDDGKPRYPIDSEEHCRAAWSYINQDGNASKYTAEQLAGIKDRIRSAGQKYGVDFSQRQKAAALEAVELARPGTWQLSSGEATFTEAMLHDAARFASRTGARPAPVKLGHIDKRFDGEPAFGWLSNLRVVDDGGPVLLGDINDLPDWLAAAAPKHWPDRSVEGWTDFIDGGEKYSFVIDGLALLGCTPPGMSSIRSLRDLPQALGIAASGRQCERVVASPKTTGPGPAASPPTEKPKEAGVDPAKIREALELQPDASDDEVQEALYGAGLVAAPEPIEASASDGHEVRHGAPGTIVLASSVWDETQKTIKNLTAHVEKQKREERDDVIAKAVIAGKFTPAQRQHFSKLWDADPDGTRELIDALTPNSALAVMASGFTDADTEADTAYSALFGKVG